MGTIIINGTSIKCKRFDLHGDVNLKIEGAIADIRADGDVECQIVKGSVNAGGSIK